MTKRHWAEVLPSCRLAASHRGISFVQGCIGMFPHPQAKFPCSSHTNPSRVTDPRMNQPMETVTAVTHQQTGKKPQSQEMTCHYSGSRWGHVTVWMCPKPPARRLSPEKPIPQPQD